MSDLSRRQFCGTVVGMAAATLLDVHLPSHPCSPHPPSRLHATLWGLRAGIDSHWEMIHDFGEVDNGATLRCEVPEEYILVQPRFISLGDGVLSSHLRLAIVPGAE